MLLIAVMMCIKPNIVPQRTVVWGAAQGRNTVIMQPTRKILQVSSSTMGYNRTLITDLIIGIRLGRRSIKFKNIAVAAIITKEMKISSIGGGYRPDISQDQNCDNKSKKGTNKPAIIVFSMFSP